MAAGVAGVCVRTWRTKKPAQATQLVMMAIVPLSQVALLWAAAAEVQEATAG